MPRYLQQLQKLFDRGHAILAAASEHWRQHTNRRTLVIIVVTGAVLAWAYLYVIQPPDQFPTDRLVSVPSGESVQQVGTVLEQEGVIRSPLMFRVLIKLMGNERTVHAGDYIFKQPLDVFSIARAISVGAYGLEPVRIRIPEGATTAQMAIIFSSQLLRFDPATFLSLARAQEGYLFPDTYNFLPNASEAAVIEAMRQNFDAKLNATTTDGTTLAQDVAASGHSLSDIVIMASIVEHEASDTKDRRMIAGVLWNRLARGMPLQSDVTLQYVVVKPDNQLTIQDLRNPSPYNTYAHTGLPPTPVDSPSLDSLIAAATPIKSNYLYYFADSSGVTHYSVTYAQHKRLIAMYSGG